MSDRRFNEAEVAAIFERATAERQPDASQLNSSTGMTLAELQQIGAEVGISADSIALAAQAIELSEATPDRTLFGLPVGVSRTVHLDRRLTDEEWELLVVDLRDTFGARGRVSASGSLRQWTNGNLAALVEPTVNGQRVRLRTTKGNAIARIAVGGLLAALSGTGLIAAVSTGATADHGLIGALSVLGLMGGGMFVSTALSLPRWAATRRRQMEEIAARLLR